MRFQAEVRSSIGWRWSDGATFDDRLDYARQWLEAEATGSEAAWLIEGQALDDGQSVTLDLSYLVRDVLGDLLVTSLAEVDALLVVNHTAGGGQLLVGGAPTDAWDAPFDGGRMIVLPDGAAMLASRSVSWPVDQAHRHLRLAASGGDVQYSIALLGTMPGSSSSSP